MNPTRQGAQSLAVWLRAFYPMVYSALAQKAAAESATRRTIQGLNGFGCAHCDSGLGDTYGISFDASTPEIDTTPLIDIPTTFDTVDPTTLGPATITSMPDVQAATASVPPAPVTTPVDTSPSVLGAVGSFLASPQGLTSLIGIGTAVIQNKTSQNVLQTQVARVAAGGNPAALSYRVNPVTGQVTPVLQSAYPGVTYPATPSLLSTLAPNAATVQITSFLQQYGLWLGLGLLVILIARR